MLPEPLDEAALAGKSSMVQLLMSARYRQPAFNEDHIITAIASAAEGGNIEIMRYPENSSSELKLLIISHLFLLFGLP